MSKLTDYRLLSFDVYGTLIDWETGVVTGLEPLTKQTNMSQKEMLLLHFELEKAQQSKTPDMPYSQLLATVYPQFAARLGLDTPTAQEAETFGKSVGNWPAFPDTVDALKRLSKHYKLVVLSNVDRESFKLSSAGPLEGFQFDKIITAQDVGSYKPDTRNFEYMLNAVKSDFGVGKDQVLQTAQSQFHDHQTARKMGIKSAWIERKGTMGNTENEAVYDWKFGTLGEMADAVEQELGMRE